MKKVLYLIFLLLTCLALFVFIFYNRYKYQAFFNSLNPCRKPILYKVESVDKRFNLSRDKLIEYTKEAADVWNGEYGKDLFVYDETGTLSVNMVFDSRQQSTNKINVLDKELENNKSELETQITAHRDNVASFKNKLAEHNSKVQFWNSQGGAPQEEYDKLTKEQAELRLLADQLNSEAKRLNLSSEDYNLQVGKLNAAISDFNQDLVEKPEEGIYLGDENRIEIYFNNNKQELVHTIAHEFGHARGLDHNNNSKSVMYPFSTRVIKVSSDDIAALGEACRERSPVEVLKTRLNL